MKQSYLQAFPARLKKLSTLSANQVDFSTSYSSYNAAIKTVTLQSPF